MCALLLLAAPIGCGDDDGALPDSGAREDMGEVDMARADLGEDPDLGPDPADMGEPVDRPTPEEMLTAALVVSSCGTDDGLPSTLDSFYFRSDAGDLTITDDQIRCLASTGGGCAALDTCVGVRTDLTGPCEPSCDGDVFSACDGDLRFTIDCARRGATCDPDEGCLTEPLGDACDFDTYEQSCTDGRPTFCTDRVTQGAVCAELGLTCTTEDGTYPGATCIGTGGACDTGSQTPWGYDVDPGTCAGDDALELCVNGGLHTITCSAVHPSLSCQTTGDGSFCARGNACDSWCMPGDVACEEDPFGSRELTCEGTEAVVCDMGEIVRIDCTTLGFTGCDFTGCTE